MQYKTDPINKSFTRGEIIANSLTHGLGAALSIAGLVFLVLRAVGQGTVWHVVSFSVYGATMILLYLASTIYHSTPNSPYNGLLQRLDHAAIYILIAGTYTPFLLTNLRGPLGWTVFGIVWGIALIGLVLKLAFANLFVKSTVAVYIIMGWLVLFVIRQVILLFQPISLVFLLVGGVLYTSGVLFYRWKSLPYGHAVWHAFVLAGSAFHYFSVMHIL